MPSSLWCLGMATAFAVGMGLSPEIETWTSIHHPDLGTLTLWKLKPETGWNSDEGGLNKYMNKCQGIGQKPIGCGSGNNCNDHPNRCLGMPPAWGCNMMHRLGQATGWNNIVTCTTMCDYGTDGHIIYVWKDGGSQPASSGYWDLSPVCGMIGDPPTTTNSTTTTTTTSTTTMLYSLHNRHSNATLVPGKNRTEQNGTCSNPAPVWLIHTVNGGPPPVVTLAMRVGDSEDWQFLGHIGHGPVLGPFGGPSFTWKLVGLGNDAYTLQNMVMNDFDKSYLMFQDGVGQGQFNSDAEDDYAQWLIPGFSS